MGETGELLFSICIACTVGSVICMLAPCGSMGKNVRTASALFMLFCICTSFSKAWKEVDVQVLLQSDDIYRQAGEIIEDNVKTSVITTTENILKEHGIAFSRIEAEICISDENEIYAETVKIHLIEETKTQETADEIFEKTGAVAEFCKAY